MGGKSYYCDYCGCYMKNDINTRKQHNAGTSHKIAKADYMLKYKDPAELLAEEKVKLPCKRIMNNKPCHFGAFCHYSHFLPEQLMQIEEMVNNLQSEKPESVNQTLSLPWRNLLKRKDIQRLPPSLQPMDFSRLLSFNFEEHWG